MPHGNDLFDVAMVSFDGTETGELSGSYLLSLLAEKYGQDIGLYRDRNIWFNSPFSKNVGKQFRKRIYKFDGEVLPTEP